jgi:nucleotide-binding universal stress UspA family protein
MRRFKNILLVVNSAENNQAALKCAQSLAQHNDARLKIVDVVKDTSQYQPILPASLRHINLHDLLIQDKGDQIDRMLTGYASGAIKASVRVLTGIPFLEIIREVIREKHDLVVITPERNSEFGDVLFGTTTMHLMRKCPCPVWAIKPDSEVRFSRILAAVNPDPENKKKAALNRDILEIASSLALMEGSELHIIHTWTFPVKSIMIPRSDLNAIRTEYEDVHRTLFEEVVKLHVPDLPTSGFHLLEGDAAVMIPRLSKETRIDLIVMGTVSRTGIPGLLIGNAAEKILQRVDCSVLAVKPEGFQSPVDPGFPPPR